MPDLGLVIIEFCGKDCNHSIMHALFNSIFKIKCAVCVDPSYRIIMAVSVWGYFR